MSEGVDPSAVSAVAAKVVDHVAREFKHVDADLIAAALCVAAETIRQTTSANVLRQMMKRNLR